MAKFKFRMQSILDIKMKLETQAKMEYASANQKYLTEQEKLQNLLLRKIDYENKLKLLMEGQLDVAKITHARSDVNTIKTMVRRQMVEVHKAEVELDKVRQRLNDIIKERKTYEKLREKAFDEFKKEIHDQEIKEIDELVSYTYNSK